MSMTPQEKQVAEAAAAAPSPFTIGGRPFVVEKPSNKDFMALRAELRRQCMAAADDPIMAVNQRFRQAEESKIILSPTLVKALAAEAITGSSSKDQKAEPSDDQMSEHMYQVSAVQWWVWYLLFKIDRGVTIGWVKEHITEENKSDFLEQLAVITGLRKIDPKGQTSATG